MSLATDIRRAFETGEPDAPNARATLINYDIDPRRVPSSITLTDAEKRQLAAVREHMRLVAKHDAFEQSAEGSLAGIVNKCTPNVRAAIAASREFVERFDQTGGRTELFQPRRELPRPDAIDQKIIDRDYHESAVSSLHDRLDTASRQSAINSQPPTMRDAIDAAYTTTTTTEHEGSDHD